MATNRRDIDQEAASPHVKWCIARMARPSQLRTNIARKASPNMAKCRARTLPEAARATIGANPSAAVVVMNHQG